MADFTPRDSFSSGVYSMDDIRRNEQQAAERPQFGELREIARDIETLLRRTLEGHQKDISLNIGISETKLSRAKTGDGGLSIADIAMLLADMKFRGVHIVEAGAGVILMSEEKAAALTVLAREALHK